MKSGNYYYYETSSGPRIGKFDSVNRDKSYNRRRFTISMSSKTVWDRPMLLDSRTIQNERPATPDEINALKANIAEGYMKINPFPSFEKYQTADDNRSRPAPSSGAERGGDIGGPNLYPGEKVTVLHTLKSHPLATNSNLKTVGNNGVVASISMGVAKIVIDREEFDIPVKCLMPIGKSVTVNPSSDLGKAMSDFEKYFNK